MHNIKKIQKMRVEVKPYFKMTNKMELYFYNLFQSVFIIGLLNIHMIEKNKKQNINNIIMI